MSGQGSSGCCLCATLAMAKRKSQGPPRTLCKTWHPCHRRVAPGPHLDDSIDSAMPCLCLPQSHGIPGGRDWEKQSSSPGTRQEQEQEQEKHEAGPVGGYVQPL